MFSHIVITAPAPRTAQSYAYQCELLKPHLDALRNAKIVAVPDPEGQRIGSGGGTLNALSFLVQRLGVDLQSARVAILHSGGDSRRSPLNTVCGKAWATINSFSTDDSSSQLWSTPMALLIQELSSFCSLLPAGSVVVGCSDVLLDIVKGAEKPAFLLNAVHVVSVSVPMQVAMNHGIVVYSSESPCSCAEPPVISVCPIERYLQKPSLAELSVAGAIEAANRAQIDTGVVIFTGSAATMLSELLKDESICRCTQIGIEAESSAFDEKVLRLELYSDILLSLKISQGDGTLESYFRRLGRGIPANVSFGSCDQRNLEESALIRLWQALHEIPLVGIRVKDGSFLHLGSSKEMMSLLQSASCPELTNDALRVFTEKYDLRRSVASQVASVHVPSTSFASTYGVTVGSLLIPSTEHCLIHPTAIVEHSLLTGSYHVGKNCVVSHVGPFLGENLCIGKREECGDHGGFLLQEIAIGISGVTSENCRAVILFGREDNVKQCIEEKEATFCGVSWSEFFEITGCDCEDIWPNELAPTDRCLWNARLFLSGNIRTAEDRLQYIWFQYLSRMTRERISSATRSAPSPSLAFMDALRRCCLRWRSIPMLSAETLSNRYRCSIADLLQIGDSLTMSSWREYLITLIDEKASLAERLISPFPHQFRSFFRYYHEFGSKALVSVGCGHDICRRTFQSVIESSQSEAFAASTNDDIVALSSCVISAVWCALLHCSCCPSSEMICILSSALITCFPEHAAQTLTQCVKISLTSFEDACSNTLTNPQVFNSCLRFFLNRLCSVDLARTAVVVFDVVSEKLGQDQHWIADEALPCVLLLGAYLCSDYPCESSRALQLLQDVERVLRGSYDDSFVSQIASTCSNFVSNALNDQVDSSTTGTLGETLETVAQRIIARQVEVRSSVADAASRNKLLEYLLSNDFSITGEARTFVARTPVRIDLTGGWSDTPPICYYLGGAVVNVAVQVDGRQPISCAARAIASPVVRIRSLSRNDSYGKTDLARIEQFSEDEAVYHSRTAILSCQSGKFSLVRAALIVLGLNSRSTRDIESPFLRGLEICTCSDLPAGSGMGGSSILAAAVLTAISAVISDALGTELDVGPNDKKTLLRMVSEVEQVMTTGGGWQDQVGGIWGGFKIGRCSPRLPIEVSVEELPMPLELVAAFEQRVVLVDTGQQRLAKNTLLNALRKISLTPRIFNCETGSSFVPCDTVGALVREAEAAAIFFKSTVGEAAEAEEFIAEVCRILCAYWTLKAEMASGSEPDFIRELFLALAGSVDGWSLCGAGAGGYAAVVLPQGVEMKQFEDTINYLRTSTGCLALNLHHINVDNSGLRVEAFPGESSRKSLVELILE